MFVKYLLVLISFSFFGFMSKFGTVKYYLIEKKVKGVGYSRTQNILELNYDSTFYKEVTFQRNKKGVYECVKYESFEGSWYISGDTLILEYNPSDSIQLTKSKFLIGKRRIYHIPTHHTEMGKIKPSKYPWKVLIGNHIYSLVQSTEH